MGNDDDDDMKLYGMQSYLWHTKSSGSSTLFAFGKLKMVFFFSHKDRASFALFSMLFDHYLYNIIATEF